MDELIFITQKQASEILGCGEHWIPFLLQAGLLKDTTRYNAEPRRRVELGEVKELLNALHLATVFDPLRDPRRDEWKKFLADHS